MDGPKGKRVAVIGSGISGLSAAYILHRNGAHVTLFESEATCGGHTLTDRTSPYPVDLGFQVYNLTTYPHLVGFLDCLGVDTEPSDMSFSLSMDHGTLEWGSHNLDSIFAQRKNLASPSFLGMVKDVIRFGKEAPKVLEPANAHVFRDMRFGAYLKAEGYSKAFIYNYVVPMCAAVWSVPNAQVLDFPVVMLVRFWKNHHLLDLFQRPLWRVIKGRSQEYVNKVCQVLPDVRTSTPVASVKRAPAGTHGPVVVTTAANDSFEFDSVVLATHSDISLRLLGGDADPAEREVLEAIPYNDNDIYLHTDTSLMPINRKVWASWNFLGASDAKDDSAVCVTYWANRLQTFPAGAPDLFVTLNPSKPPAEDTIIRKLKLAHPVFGFASVAAQARLPEIQGNRGTYFAGAWAGYGFHEDGIRSAVAALTTMGCTLPWTPRTTSSKQTWSESFYLWLFDRYAQSAIVRGYLRIILPSGHELRYGSLEDCEAPVPAGEQWRGRPPLRATLRVFSMDFFRKIVMRHDTGLGEAYMEGDYEADDLGGLMAVLVANSQNMEEQRGKLGVLNWVGDRLLYLAHKARPNTITGSRKNIEEHYDAGNAMYKLFLDETMTYSSGVYLSPEDSLHQSQLNKIDALIAKADIQPTDHVLEIGCGWGGFGIRAVQRTGCRWTGITVSKEQLAEAVARVKAAGLEDRITFMFCDYRDLQGDGTFDKVVSVEMIEAVGHEHLLPYFSVIGRMLKPGGKAVIQAISCAEERYDAYCASSDFIREHIFPGGHLPCLGAMVEACRGTGLVLRDSADIGPDYAVTLREWRKRWTEKRDEVLALGYSERFWRKYIFYFVYCEAGFDARYIHNYHVVFVKDPSAAASTATTASSANTLVSHAASGLHLPAAIADELPSDPITQLLLGLYFFLAGMLVRSHPHMWLLPLMSLVTACACHGVHMVSRVLLPFYATRLSPVKQAWWCADTAHLLYSGVVAMLSAGYVMRNPSALLLSRQPSDTWLPSVMTATSAGVFAFHLWMHVRKRLFMRSYLAIVQYTLLLVLFAVALYKHVALPFLAATLVSEAYSVPYLMGKMMDLAGVSPTSPARRATHLAERACLVVFRLVPHTLVALAVLTTPSAFASRLYYLLCLLGSGFMSYMNVHKLQHALKQQQLQQRQPSPAAEAAKQHTA